MEICFQPVTIKKEQPARKKQVRNSICCTDPVSAPVIPGFFIEPVLPEESSHQQFSGRGKYVSNVEGLASSEERYRTLIEWLPEGIMVYRPEGIAYMNPAGSRLLGVDRGENLAGIDLFSMVDPGFQELFRQRIKQAELGARLNLDTVRLIRKEGSGVTIDMVFGRASCGKGTAVQILIRNI
jgi:PAS domain S-box-containing protein